MKNCNFILLSCFLFSSALFAQQTAVLFQWETDSGKQWKTFGDEAVQLKYEGEIKNGKPDGLGVSTLHGTTFFGNWKEGNKHGRGTYTSSFGLRYTGEFRHGRRDGKGTLTTSDGERYVGEFKDGKKHGQGYEIYVKSKNLIKLWRILFLEGKEFGIKPVGLCCGVF